MRQMSQSTVTVQVGQKKKKEPMVMASIHVAILALSIHEQNFQSDVALSALGAF